VSASAREEAAEGRAEKTSPRAAALLAPVTTHVAELSAAAVPVGFGRGRVVVSERAAPSRRFSKTGTECLYSASAVKWMGGGAKRQCDRALNPSGRCPVLRRPPQGLSPRRGAGAAAAQVPAVDVAKVPPSSDDDGEDSGTDCEEQLTSLRAHPEQAQVLASV
jgi:hypothetical protein